MFKFEVPSLTVGTLDTLMTLSDDLVKTDQVEVESTRNTDKLSSAKEKIYELADQGKDVTEISHLVNITQGEAELLLRMRNFKIDQ